MIALWLAGAALAANCFTPCSVDCLTWSGSSEDYSINTTDISISQAAAIDRGADAWRAGPAAINRGATWQFTRGPDTSSDGTLNDGVNDVSMLSDAQMSAIGAGANTIAQTWITWYCPTNTFVEFNIGFRETIIWTTDLPSNASSGASIGQTALHEFGHAAGLRHENSVLASMNWAHPFGGDMSTGLFRIGEDDFVGLIMVAPGADTART